MTHKRFIPLRNKIALAVIIVCALLAAVTILLSYQLYSSTMVKHYKTTAVNIARTAASQMDPVAIQRYLETEQVDEQYDALLDVLYEIKESNDCHYLYVQQLHGDSVTYVLDADTGPNACPLGLTIEVEEQIVIDAVAEGRVPDPFIYNGEFGWLCTGLAPILDENGNIIAVAGADISMNEVMTDRANYLQRVLAAVIMVAAACVLTLIVLFETFVVRPIKRMASATRNFVTEKEAGQSSISELSVHTRDELETLCTSVQTMESQINEYIEHLTTVTMEKERIGAELNVAANIQSSMLPCIFPAFPEHDEFDIFATMRPAKEVGGDFYDFFFVDDDHLAIVIADVSGKGVPAALIMVIAKELIKSQMQAGSSPSEAFVKVNQQLCENNKAGMFVTAWAALIELSTGRVQYANAGHNPPVCIHADGTASYLTGRSGFVLAGRRKMRYLPLEMTLESGDALYLYTDGVTEATDMRQQLFGEDRLLATLTEQAKSTPMCILNGVHAAVDAFVGEAPQFDDITMLAIRRLPPFIERVFPAELGCVEDATAFVRDVLSEGGCPKKMIVEFEVAVDELFSNVCKYSGAASITIGCRVAGQQAFMHMIDGGTPFDLRKASTPDVTLPAGKRAIGGLGIHIVQSTMDSVRYRYENGQNIATIEKSFK